MAQVRQRRGSIRHYGRFLKRVHHVNPSALVTGGTGLIGGEVIVALARQGFTVRAVVRAESLDAARQRLLERLEKSDSYDRHLAERIHPLPGDSTQPWFGLDGASMAGVATIVHCAANTQFSEREDEYVWRTNVTGAEQLVALTHAAAPSARVVFVSTASVVTAPEGTLLDETAPFAGHTNTYTLSKRRAEDIVAGSGLDVVILRPTIVLSRGVRDRAMARSILWAVPIMNELGDIPVERDSRIDIVPVDYTARCLANIAVKPTLRYRLYHVSAGADACTFGQLRDAVVAKYPEMGRIHPVGRDAKVSSRAMARLLRPLEAYLPFLNADICYSNERLVSELGEKEGRPPSATSYVPDLVGQVSLRDAMQEMYRP